MKGFHVPLTSARQIPAGDADKTHKKEVAALMLLNSTSYNGLIHAQ